MDTQQQPPKNSHSHKKRALEIDTSSDSEEPTLHMWPRFLIVQGTSKDSPLAKLNPFAIEKGLKGLAGTPTSVKRLRSGDLIIEVSKRSHSENLLRSKMLANCPIQVVPHRSMNSKKGVIRCRDLADTSEEEILDNLSSQGITEVRKIRVQRDGRRINTGTIILTFGLPVLPTSVKIGFLRVKVDVYIPNPLRCFKCQRYGHHRMACKRELTCAKCGTTGHEDKECRQKPHCVNCDGDHGSFSRDCPLWKKEKDIQTIKVTQGISFPEARKVVEQRGSTPTSARSYSDVAGVTKRSVACQTDMTWPLGALQPSQTPKQKHPVSKAVSTMTVADATQSEVTPATKTRLQTKKGDTPSPSSVMEPLTSQTVSTKRSSNKTKQTHVGSKPTTPPKPKKKTLSDREKKGDKNPIIAPNKYNVLEDILDGSSMDYDDLDNPGHAPSGTLPE